MYPHSFLGVKNVLLHDKKRVSAPVDTLFIRKRLNMSEYETTEGCPILQYMLVLIKMLQT